MHIERRFTSTGLSMKFEANFEFLSYKQIQVNKYININDILKELMASL